MGCGRQGILEVECERSQLRHIVFSGVLLESSGNKDKFLPTPNELRHTFFAQKTSGADIAKAVLTTHDQSNEAISGKDEVCGQLRGGQQFDIGLRKAQKDLFHAYIL